MGVKQGDGLSAMLFNITLHAAISKINKRGSIFTKSSQICAYADDVTIIARSEKDSKNVYMKLEEEVNKYRLITNMNKTKYMVIYTNKIRNQTEDKKFQVAKVFRYFGMIINNQSNITGTIKEKIRAGNKAHYSNLHLLKNITISRKAKSNTYKTLIRPIVSYGSEVWTLNNKTKMLYVYLIGKL
jgi:sorting nexin-29